MSALHRPTLSLEILDRRDLLAADLGLELTLAPETETSTVESGERAPYYKYKLDRLAMSGSSVGGDTDGRPSGGVTTRVEMPADTEPMAWDNTKQIKWQDSGIQFNPAAVDEAFAAMGTPAEGGCSIPMDY